MAPRSEYPFTFNTDGRLIVTKALRPIPQTQGEIARKIKADGLGVLLSLLAITVVPNAVQVPVDQDQSTQINPKHADGATSLDLKGTPVPYRVGGAPANSMCNCLLPPGPKR